MSDRRTAIADALDLVGNRLLLDFTDGDLGEMTRAIDAALGPDPQPVIDAARRWRNAEEGTDDAALAEVLLIRAVDVYDKAAGDG